MGLVAWRLGDVTAATELLAQSLAIRAIQGNRTRIAECLEGLARVAEPSERSARLLGAASALREVAGTPLPLAERSDHERLIDAVRGTVRQAVFAVAWDQGRAMSLDEAVAYALTDGVASRSKTPGC